MRPRARHSSYYHYHRSVTCEVVHLKTTQLHCPCNDLVIRLNDTTADPTQ